MKKRIRLTEGQLYRLIENTILNELDVRTKLHAAEKADQYYNNAHANNKYDGEHSFSNFYNTNAANKAYVQRRNFMSGVANDMQKHIKQMRRDKGSYKPELPYKNFKDFDTVNKLRNEYQTTATDTPCVLGSKNDLNRVFRDYFQRKAYFKNGKWIDSIDDDWDEQEAKEWWAKNGGLPNDPYIGAPNSQDVAEAVIRKLRRL